MAFEVIEACKLHIESIKDITNEAFVVDKFFKKPKYFNRFEGGDVEKLMEKENSCFLIAISKSGEDMSLAYIMGSIFLHYSIDWSDEANIKVFFIMIALQIL